MKTSNKTAAEKLKLGILVVIGLSLFITGVYLVGNQQSMFGTTVKIYATFQNINGLKAGNNVRFAGMNIGTVRDIGMLNDSTLVVGMAIDKQAAVHITSDATAAIGSDGLVGNMIINILPGKSGAAPVTAGDTLASFRRLNTDEMLATLNITNENAALLTAELLKITRDINSANGPLSMLIRDKVAAENMSAAILDIRRTSAAALGIMRHTDQLVLSLNDPKGFAGLMRDSTTAMHLRTVADNLDKTSNTLNDAVNELHTTLVSIRESKGTLDYLVKDTTLKVKIDTTIAKVDGTLDQLHQAGIKLNENLEALKHNFLFRGYFKKLEKGKK